MCQQTCKTTVQAHPNVPVVENLEDLWKLGKLQRERKLRAAKVEADIHSCSMQKAKGNPLASQSLS